MTIGSTTSVSGHNGSGLISFLANSSSQAVHRYSLQYLAVSCESVDPKSHQPGFITDRIVTLFNRQLACGEFEAVVEDQMVVK